MNSKVAEVLAAAEALTLAERRELLDFLGIGLDAANDPGTSLLSAGWQQEIARRSAEFDAGQAETVAWAEIQDHWQFRREADG